ncbi:arginine--tRNA ligase [bacterium]|jgi:arginyl-tRNA synthetase|nr:arginine--tRNA ligase [bacterium]MBT3795100.1 arginine--tRNA ligase [bacterium]MBT4634396.1 arginine--tRNA ligase [bacterium]
MLTDKITEKIKNSLLNDPRFADLDFSNLLLSIPRNPDHGDFSTNFAMINSSRLKSKPIDLAQEMLNLLKKSDDSFFQDISIEKPGFINFVISNKIYQRYLADVVLQGVDYGSGIHNNKKVLIEFVSANPTGLLHLGHLRNAAVGDSIARILKFSGYDVVKEYYVNDYGNQVRLLGESLKERVLEKLKLDFNIPEGGYKGDYLIDVAETLLLTKDSRSILKEETAFFSNFAISCLTKEIEKDLEDLDINFDSWYSEKEKIHDSDSVINIKKLIMSANGLYKKEKAEWIKTSEYGDNDDWVITKSDDSSTYFMNDIAYHHDKFLRGFDKIVNVWGADHHSHISRLKASMKLLSNDLSKLDFVLIQFVRLIKDGQDVSMSKRSGTYTTIKDMLNEFNKDLVRFMMVSRSSDSHFDFDLDKCREGSDDNPIFYIQYASARINSILNKHDLNKDDTKSVDLSLLTEEKEIKLIKKILSFPDTVEEASGTMSPHKIAFYLQELAAIFHSYYKSTKVLIENDELSKARILLLSSIKIVFVNGLNLLGVSSPERM